MDKISSAERYVRYFYEKYFGRIAIGVGYTNKFEEIFPLVFQDNKDDSIGIIALDVVPDEEKMVYIYHLGAFKTNDGNGSVMLKELCDQADRFNVCLKVSPNVMPNGKEPSIETEQLVNWYKRYGFEGNFGLLRNPQTLRRE